ncbi:MAG: hypothetical protein N3F67_00110 [Acidilobaceae archaeon]|nr:hypothetical protein [Acidilobaceae archaeon]
MRQALIAWGGGAVKAFLSDELVLEFRNAIISIGHEHLSVTRAFEVRDYRVNKRRYFYVHLPPLEPLELRSVRRRAELGPFEVASLAVGPLDIIAIRPMGKSFFELVAVSKDRVMLEPSPGRDVRQVREGEGAKLLVL